MSQRRERGGGPGAYSGPGRGDGYPTGVGGGALGPGGRGGGAPFPAMVDSARVANGPGSSRHRWTRFDGGTDRGRGPGGHRGSGIPSIAKSGEPPVEERSAQPPAGDDHEVGEQ